MKQSTLVKQSLLTTSTCQPPQANTNCSDNGCEKPAEGDIKGTCKMCMQDNAYKPCQWCPGSLSCELDCGVLFDGVAGTTQCVDDEMTDEKVSDQ